MKTALFTGSAALVLATSALLHAAPSVGKVTPADNMLREYFRTETARLTDKCLGEIETLDDWTARRAEYRRQAAEMLGLWPAPPRTDLKAVVTGRLEHDSIVVENLHFQSMPGLYVTANLYRPKTLAGPAPTILYLCGHGPLITNGVSYGNKVSYQHHGIWFARSGYVCLVLDTLQLGEIQGKHHGTHHLGEWWWTARGYTPAGVEAWNGIRALDYLSTRPEVDTNRFGVTGRSGGGAYSWTLAALDERVKAVAPVAGITDLQNHVVDDTVDGHCDCMFFLNTYRWDYPMLAALVAPRPLLLVNTDADTIFPLDGVLRTHKKLRKLYDLHRATNSLGLVIGPGPHKDTQDLQVPVFRWFNRHLKNEDPVINQGAVKLFSPEQLKVFSVLPSDQVNTDAERVFVPPAAVPAIPASAETWRQQREAWMKLLTEKTFAGWPAEPDPLEVTLVSSSERQGVRLETYEFTSEQHVYLRFYVARNARLRKAERAVLSVFGPPAFMATNATPVGPAVRKEAPELGATFAEWLAAMQTAFADDLFREQSVLRAMPKPPDAVQARQRFSDFQVMLRTSPNAFAWFAPRGVGMTAWSGDEKRQTQIRRRFLLLGKTLEGMRVWDVRRALQALRDPKALGKLPLVVEAQGDMAANVLYASLFEPAVAQLSLVQLPESHMQGPDYLNVLRVLDLPQAVALGADRSGVRIDVASPEGWEYPVAVAGRLGWDRARFSVE